MKDSSGIKVTCKYYVKSVMIRRQLKKMIDEEAKDKFILRKDKILNKKSSNGLSKPLDDYAK